MVYIKVYAPRETKRLPAILRDYLLQGERPTVRMPAVVPPPVPSEAKGSEG